MAGKLSAFFGAQDMTVGNPATNLIRFSTPLLIGNLAQQLYSTVDSIVVGNYVGDSALAAIGASGPIINLLQQTPLLSGLLVTELVYYYLTLSFVLPVIVGVLFTLLHALIQTYVLVMLTSVFYGEASEPAHKKAKKEKAAA